MTRWYWLGGGLVLLLVVALGGLAWWVLSDNESQSQAPEYETAPPFELLTYSGDTVRLSDSSGRVRVINFWATWCSYCVDELPLFAQLQERYPMQVVVYAINRAEDPRNASAFIDVKLTLPEALVWLDDPRDSYYKALGASAMPFTLFLDGEGKIRHRQLGPMTLSAMEAQVEALLGE